jgi:hypothetical protein
MTGGFFIGPGAFYEALRRLPEPERARIDMTRIDFINQLYGKSAEETQLKREQRRKARFMNTTMKVTLLGAAASDALESGAVVSGVGGQYNFVAMAHALPDARSILMLRATHETAAGPVSNIVWSYGHTTIPRHLRDIVITEYGVADLRAQSDGEIVKRLIAIADSRFQPELVAQAKAHGKLESAWELPASWAHNTPQELDARLHPFTEVGLLPGFPFGTDLTADELKIVAALRRLKKATQHPVELVTLALRSFWEGKEAPPAYLQRLGLDEAQGFKALFIRKLFAGNVGVLHLLRGRHGRLGHGAGARTARGQHAAERVGAVAPDAQGERRQPLRVAHRLPARRHAVRDRRRPRPGRPRGAGHPVGAERGAHARQGGAPEPRRAASPPTTPRSASARCRACGAAAHRNPQGAAVRPGTSDLWLTEHGPQGGDEVNRVLAGRNYGWPLVSYGCPYGSPVGDACRVGGGTHAPTYEEPKSIWVPTSIAPGGIAFYTGAGFPEWQGHLFVTALAGQTLWRLVVDANDNVTLREEVAAAKALNRRIRHVRQGPDGWLYLLTDDGRIVRLAR